MKKILVGAFCGAALCASAQRNMVIFDPIDRLPVEYAKAFGADGRFLAVSNGLGQIVLAVTDYPAEIKCVGYKPTKIEQFQDTVFLEPKYQDVQQMNAKPVNCLELYQAILDNSSAHIQMDNSTRFGTFFQSMMLVDTKFHDTIRVEGVCEMAIRKTVNKKKISYEIFAANGRKSYSVYPYGAGKMVADPEDSTVFKQMVGMMQDFDKNMEFDLGKTKPYQLKFEENQVRRELGQERSTLRFESADKRSNNVDVQYQDSLLYRWNYHTYQFKEYDGSGIYVNNRVNNRLCEFDPQHYELSTVINYQIIEIGLGGVVYEFHFVKGFFDDETRKFECKTPVKKVEDYLESLPDGGYMNPFYNFAGENPTE